MKKKKSSRTRRVNRPAPEKTFAVDIAPGDTLLHQFETDKAQYFHLGNWKAKTPHTLVILQKE